MSTDLIEMNKKVLYGKMDELENYLTTDMNHIDFKHTKNTLEELRNICAKVFHNQIDSTIDANIDSINFDIDYAVSEYESLVNYGCDRLFKEDRDSIRKSVKKFTKYIYMYYDSRRILGEL